MPTLVTGGTGFVGTAVVRALLARGEAVRCLARPGGDRRNLAGLDVEIVEGDLTDPASLTRAARGVEALYHVAADYRLWIPDPAAMEAANVQGSVNVIRAALDAGARRAVYTSSVAVLKPHADGTPADEDTPTTEADMIGAYKGSKFRAERAVRALVADGGAPVVIVNPSTPIGPRDIKPTPTGRIIVEAAAGRMPAYVDTGLNVAHVDDVAAGHLRAFDHGTPGERYILGGENLTLADILGEVARLCGRRPPRVRLPHDLILPFAWAAEGVARITHKEPFATVDGLRMAKKHMFFTCAKAERDLGYRARPAAEAIADAVAWFRANDDLR
ncbi:NAD-dependent epimerase/dehydratase family protein [Roseospira marina]|uniref:NAD-dependent epimerase/dehydratase family protein n=1 Tax=Roseospira marina TaxID=140057 RepID=A0A5M6IFX3_9PROT|nr:hopanoid-associated sugar epimerase [Roseospira marina]KAA5606649.1 NAD-dependent epimerase/dehydratase family protein [Roseospira marina]MBB4313946.1 dihydroflavonol-4-reductase [Roseospira marina]MBB5087108.1 dihydroflavonol-4-reductase [Roseospira marina]